jgi:hypothetical protein
MNLRSLTAKTQTAFSSSGSLRHGECPFSTNKVTRYSLNYPIAKTCRPTTVCAKTCYFGAGPATWPASLQKQARLYNSTVADPAGTAEAIVEWTRRLKLSFVRWNGGGDLFRESVLCLNKAASLMPSVPQWVVTRLPEHAVKIEPRSNVFVHFSVDKSSWHRVEEMYGYAGNWFWSYQCDRGESPPKSLAPVVFYDGYDPAADIPLNEDDCPLNSADTITDVCESCRRCFDGRAVSRARELSIVLRSRR